MNPFSEQLKNPAVAGVVGFVAGLILGWFVIGWGLYPVEWTDASPAELRSDAREDYLRLSIAAYGSTQNAAEAQRLWRELGEAGPDTLAAIEANPGALPGTTVQAFKMAVGASVEAEEPAAEDGPSPLLWVACVVTLVLGFALLGTYMFRRRPPPSDSPAVMSADANRTAERTDYAALGEDPPLSQFMTTYMLGDDLFDDSFSIDSPAGEFLGECGVGIADTLGASEPKNVNAFEVWLFDKNDIQTVTKVLMSSSSFSDISTQERLAAKGEPILATAENSVLLETATLQLIAKVVDISYGDDPALPEKSHFKRLTLELAVWQKQV